MNPIAAASELQAPAHSWGDHSQPETPRPDEVCAELSGLMARLHAESVRAEKLSKELGGVLPESFRKAADHYESAAFGLMLEAARRRAALLTRSATETYEIVTLADLTVKGTL